MKIATNPESRGYTLRMALPIFCVQLMQILVNNVDQMMVSAYSQEAVAAVGNANQISWLLMMLFTILSTATVILVTQYKGAGRTEEEKVIYPLSLLANIIAGLLVGAVCIFFGREIFRLMNISDPVVCEYAYQYLSITGGSIVFMSIMTTYNAFFRSNSLMKQSMIISIIVNLVNIVGNWFLISGHGPFPAMGVKGVAIATMISRIIGAVLLAFVYRINLGKIQWSLLRHFPFAQFKRILSIGIPAAGESISYNSSQLVVMSMINSMGLAATNTKIYIYLIVSFCYIFASALSETNQVSVGYFVGAKKPDEADKRVWRVLSGGVILAVLMTGLICLFSDDVLGLFVSMGGEASEEMVAEIFRLGKQVLLVEIFLELGRASNIVMVKALQAAGDIRFPVAMNVIFTWFFSVGVGYLLGIVLGWGLVGIWIAMCCDEVLRGLVLILRWRSGVWRGMSVIEDSQKAPVKHRFARLQA